MVVTRDDKERDFQFRKFHVYIAMISLILILLAQLIMGVTWVVTTGYRIEHLEQKTEAYENMDKFLYEFRLNLQRFAEKLGMEYIPIDGVKQHPESSKR